MKNSLMINNFFRERPKTGHSKQELRSVSRTSTHSGIKTKPDYSRELTPSRLSSDYMSPRDISSRNSNRLRPKSSKVNGRISDYSIDIGSDEDISVSDLDEEEEEEGVDGSNGNTARNYWSNLDDSIKRINDDSDKLALKPRPNFKSSPAFKDVMTEMSGNTEYGVSKGYTLLKDKISRLTNVTSLTAKALSQATKSENEEDDHKEDNDSDDEIKEVENRASLEENLKSSVGGAKRAWRVLQTHVAETGVEHRTTSVKMNWEAIRHHVAGISDMDKARIDLYERYGFLPSVQEDGSKVCKNVMWLNRTSARIMKDHNEFLMKGRLRAQSARPFTTQNANRLRSMSGESMPNGQSRPISCNMNNFDNTRLRPSSEKLPKTRVRPQSVKTTKFKQ